MNYSLKQGPFRAYKNLILASVSPRRQKLLATLGLSFAVQPSSIQEPDPEHEENTEQFVLKNAQLKAFDIIRKKRNGVIIAADTVVVYQKNILGKPKNKQEALQTLQLLSGVSHFVTTGCFVYDLYTGRQVNFAISSKVELASQPFSVLEAYIETGEPLDKAGSYAIQGIGSFLVEKISGSYTNVVGLPLKELVTVLMDLESIGLSNKNCSLAN